ncbi:single-stranded DNA-binding protein [Streptomyces sp. NPDC088748]|uniref:single-stranded DNA-binding protein n=1 Tax=Streptomyces sp. NPDC088748 TaxID=3365887 RepID=UPI00382A755B
MSPSRVSPSLPHRATAGRISAYSPHSCRWPIYDRDRTGFTDGEPLFLHRTLWRQAAENAAQPLTCGMRVIVTGRLKQRTFDDKEGQRRTVAEIDVEEAAPSLTYAKVTVTGTHRPGSSPATGATTTPPARQAPDPAPAKQHPF